MKGFLNELFVDRIFGFLTNSATNLDLDLKRRLVEIFFQSKKSPIRTKKKFEKDQRQVRKPVSRVAIHPRT